MRRDTTYSDLPTGLAQPARRALTAAGYVQLDQIRRVLAERGQSFAGGTSSER